MSQQLVIRFLAELEQLKKVSGSRRESVIREAFKDLLKGWARQLNLTFVPELDYSTPRKTTVYPDGTILHDLRVPLGWWESKDTDDDLDHEIEKKSARGYPRDNIIYDNSETAILIQNGREAMRCPMADAASLSHLLKLFFSYERTEIRDFRKAVEQFKTDLPAVLEALRGKINAAYDSNKPFRKAADKFLTHAKNTINPMVTEEDVREMLIQHILTEEIFDKVFDSGDFHRENNIAKELYALEGLFFTGAVKRETLKGLESYYATIRSNAALITSHAEKQTFLKVIYENFYKVYNKKAADRLGVVYTPNEIVKFMIEGADWLCEKHFGKNLIDRDVEILDPATGTGTFICELLESFKGDKRKLAHKYKEELHANEVAILPYYVANLNIEATYAAITGQFAEFPNLCFVDTLDNVAGLGIRAGHQHDLFAALSEENVERVKRQNRRKISVIIGNPPYNANQQNWNDDNKNRSYPRIDERVRSTYVAASRAQKPKSYDMFSRFIRWASDRIHDEGVVAFITNRSFVDKKTFDGFRRTVGKEFAEIRIVDLGGDWKLGNANGGGGNVFPEIGTGVAIGFFVAKKASKQVAKVYYTSCPVREATEKLTYVSSNSLSSLDFEQTEDVLSGFWVDNPEQDFSAADLPIASKSTKKKKLGATALFKSFSLGISTNRDGWVYDKSETALAQKNRYLVSAFESAVVTGSWDDSIKWSDTLEEKRKSKVSPSKNCPICLVEYRPFNVRHFASNLFFVDRPGAFNQIDWNDNVAICFTDPAAQKPWLVIAVCRPPDLHIVGSGAGAIVLAKHSRSSDPSSNITDWGLKQFQNHYEKAAKPKRCITKDDIFHYVYGVLHDPVYRETYALNLKREFPRIPFYPDFWKWAEWGEKLMQLHIHYEEVEPWAITRRDVPVSGDPKVILKADAKAGTITLDSATTLSGIPPQAFDYRLGNRSGLEWVLDQHKEKKPKDPTIAAKFNTYRFKDYKEKVVDLLARVTRVSVETIAITEAMRSARRD